MVKKRNGYWYIYFYPFKEKKIGIKLPTVSGKTQANQVEAALLFACRSGVYSGLDPVSREACIRMFQNQGWELPADLVAGVEPREELTLWRASELFMKSPEIKAYSGRWRYEYCLANLVEKMGKEAPVKKLWVPQLKSYQVERLNEGAAPSSVNWELSTLSKIFGFLIEHRLVEVNPVLLVKRLSTKSGERQVYLSFKDVMAIANAVPNWAKPIILTAYYSGMRRGEILDLTTSQVNLEKRIINLSPEHTKEAHWKRVPIHRELVPVLREALKVRCLNTDRVFHLQDKHGVRALETETFKNVWPRVCKALKLEDPLPRFHDLRHTWRANARRSSMDPSIAESILGHWFRGKSVNDRYGYLDDSELIAAIDAVTFDNGETTILVARDKKSASTKNSNSIVTGSPRTRKSGSAR